VLGYRVSTFEHQFMHVSGLLFFTLIAIFWIAHGLRVAIGALQLPWLKRLIPAAMRIVRESRFWLRREMKREAAQALRKFAAHRLPGLELLP